MTARLEIYVERRAAGLIASVAQGLDFGMITAKSAMKAGADDFAIANNDGANQGVRADEASPALGQLKGPLQEFFVLRRMSLLHKKSPALRGKFRF
jgi:hypothetical protein